MTIIRELFSKDQGITKQDVENLTGKVQETFDIECKLVPDKVTKDQKEDMIIKPVIGFLNKIDNTGGLLILGAQAPKELIERIKPFSVGLLSQSQVVDVIKGNVAPIPFSTNSFTLNVQSVSYENSMQVILVEVGKNDSKTFYYSKFSNTSYERKGQSTEKLEISELFRRVEFNRTAKVYMEVVNEGVENLE